MGVKSSFNVSRLLFTNLGAAPNSTLCCSGKTDTRQKAKMLTLKTVLCTGGKMALVALQVSTNS